MLRGRHIYLYNWEAVKTHSTVPTVGNLETDKTISYCPMRGEPFIKYYKLKDM